MTSKISRIHVVDALRGFAIVSIMLLHNIEHFDFYFTPTGLPAWMIALDKWIWDSLFFLFGGKSYAIFSLLFGLTFFIQSDNQKRKGRDFRGRFAWRLGILFLFALVNSAFYEGDILFFYSIIGLVLIPVWGLKDKTVFWIAVLLMLQPFELYKLIYAIGNPNMPISDPVSWSYFGKMGSYITDGSLLDVFVGNLTNGKTAVVLWNWENGRIFQTASLFMFGMLAGRVGLFNGSNESIRFWKKTLIVSAALFIPMYFMQLNLGKWIPSAAINRSVSTIETSWTNMAFMLILVSGFVLLFNNGFFNKLLNVFSPCGKMSLSNYILQSMLGSWIYYGYGLGLYKYTSSTYCIMIGIILAILQCGFSKWWMEKYKRGPLETLWHKATWYGGSN